MYHPFRYPVRFIAGCAVVSLPREVDFGNADTVLRTLLSVLSCGVSGLVVDMSETRYSDSAGIRAIVRARHRAKDLGCWARAVIPHPGVRKAFAVTGAQSLIQIYASLDPALPRGRDDAAGPPEPPVLRLVPRPATGHERGKAAHRISGHELGKRRRLS